jgi:hypothetical protein
MSVDNVIKQAERSGVSMSKEALINMLRNSTRKQYPMVKDGQGALIVVPVTKDGKVRG